MDLQADNVQGVLFLTPGQAQDDAIKLWESLFPGDSPDAFQRANTSPSSILVSTASGERSGHQVVVTANVGRIDITLYPPQATIGSPVPARIADVAGAAKHLASMLKLFTERLEVLRIALVLDLSKTVSPGGESAALLELLPEFPFPKNVLDVALQFNSRRPLTTVPDLEINRLCIWTTGHIGVTQIVPGRGHVMMRTSPFVGIKVDINTAPEAPPTSGASALIIDEMLAESLIIYHDGLKRFER